MPKQVDYPRNSLQQCKQLASAVYDLGGACTIEMAADKLGKKVTGAFGALVASTVKYGLLTNKKGQLSITNLYREYKLAYTDEDSKQLERKAFLSVPLFQAIVKRFENKKLPVSHFQKLLIREFEVPDQLAPKVTNFFLEGAKQTALMNADNVLSYTLGITAEEIQTEDISTPSPEERMDDVPPPTDQDQYSIRIKGPGMDSVITVNEQEDLSIVQAMLKKVEKRLQKKAEE
jgi:hypothetical protein